jgi:hypothetical protein
MHYTNWRRSLQRSTVTSRIIYSVDQRVACIRLGDSVVVWHCYSSDVVLVSFFALSLLEATLSTAPANLVKFTLANHSAIPESNHRRRHRRLHQSLVYGWCDPSYDVWFPICRE